MYSLVTHSLFLLLLCPSALACGTSSDQRASGYTACGSVTCQPGQYCEDPRFESCVAGCLSNDNCLGDQFCDTDAFSPTCQNQTGAPPMSDGGPAADGLAACQAACDHFQSCGLPAGDTAECRAACSGLTADQQQAVANCDGVVCSSVTTCLGVDCLNASDCPAGAECLGTVCL